MGPCLCYCREMEPRILQRLTREFEAAEHEVVVQLLASYSGPECDRVRWDILKLSNGSIDKIREYVRAANTDYRDILYWAEYYKDDPMLQGRDQKQLVDEILRKWGTAKDG
jgi:hypothetical protein